MAPTSGKRKRGVVAPAPVNEESPFIVGDGAKVTENGTDELLSKLEPGDHIAATRKNELYEHHGIYGGMHKGYPSVIHLQCPQRFLGNGSPFSLPCAKCGYHHPKEEGIVLTCFDCFSLGQNTYKLQYRLKADLVTKKDPNWNQLIPGRVIEEYRKKCYYLEQYNNIDGQLYGHRQVRKKWCDSYKLEDQIRFYKNSSNRSGWEVFDTARRMTGLLVGQYHLGKFNCEHFAVFCKTSKQIASDKAEAAYTDLGKLVEILEPGDHIAAKRKKGIYIYEHHGIYAGMPDGYPLVIHFQGPLQFLGKGSAFSSPCAICGHQHPEEGGKVFTCLDCFSLGQNTYKLQYRLKANLVTKKDQNWKQLRPGNVIKGYCEENYYLEHYKEEEDQLYGHSKGRWEEGSSKYKLDKQLRFYEFSASLRSGKEVVDIAQKTKCGPYHFLINNCEHFATFCKTGSSKSVQVKHPLRIAIPCRNQKRACPFSSGGTPNKRRKQNPKEPAGSSESRGTKDEEEKVLLRSSERIRTGNFHKTARALKY